MDVSCGPEFAPARYAHPCDWNQDFAPLCLPGLFAASAGRHPATPLIDFFGRAFSYAALHDEARAFAAGLQQAGIARGDRVGLFLPNVPAYVPAYFGAMIAGATVVNFSPLYTAEELEAQVADSGARLMVTIDVPALLPTALRVLRESPLETLVVTRLGEQLPRLRGLLVRLFGLGQVAPVPSGPGLVLWRDMLGKAPPHPVALDPHNDLALLQYTGGTTGTPKGAMLTHQNLTANARQIRAIDPDRDGRDVTLAVLPLFHVFANTCVLNRTIANGGTLVMQPRFEAARVLAGIGAARPTSLFAVPTMLQALLDHPHAPATDFSSLREVIAGGAPLALPLKERFEKATGVPVIEGYGLTECSGVVATNPLRPHPVHGGARAGMIGQPLPGTCLRLLDREDPDKDAAPGQPGELAIRGPQVMRGYWQRPEAEAAAFARRSVAGGEERWLRTGDVATIDEDGFARIVDRMKDMIAVGGFKVFPSQVEEAILHNPAVREVLVIGVPDTYLGERPRAFVVLAPGTVETPAQLTDWVNERLGKHERVDRVVVRESLPKTMIGKLDRKALREELAREERAGAAETPGQA